MRKNLSRALCAVLVLTMLVGGAYALAPGDSLISLSYLTEVFFPKAVEAGTKEADSLLQQTGDAAKEKLDEAQKELLGQAAGEEGLYSPQLAPRDWSDGDVLTLPTGSGFLMQEGVASLTHSGAVVDVTEGKEMASGSRLAAGHRYLVGENTNAEITILSGAVRLGVQGGYALEPGEGEATPFYDVCQTDWYYAPVGYVYSNGLFSGMDEHTFAPAAVMDRAMLMTVLYRMAGAPEDELKAANVSFDDVSDSAWYSSFVKWGAAQGITAGTSPTTFSPANQITREQLVVLLYSFGTNYLGEELTLRADLSGYEDLEKSSTWARDALSWAVAQGVISSSSSDRLTLSPQKGANRAEVATMLRAFAEKIL